MPSTPRELRLVSWNVNGLRATLKKDPSFPEIFAALNADVFAIQETKLQDEQRAKLKDVQFEGYHQTWNYAERKGYSGTAVWSREEPLQVIRPDEMPVSNGTFDTTRLQYVYGQGHAQLQRELPRLLEFIGR